MPLEADMCKEDGTQINANLLQDLLISAEVVLHHEDVQQVGRVV